MAFNGYLIRKPGSTTYFPERLIVWSSYECTPNIRQDKDPTRDMSGVLHRAVVPARASTIKFSTPSLHLAEKQEIQAFFNACMVSSAERKVQIEFWDDENNVYKIETMYMPDVKYTIIYHTADDIVYAPIDFELIGYGY